MASPSPFNGPSDVPGPPVTFFARIPIPFKNRFKPGGKTEPTGFEPATSAVTGQRSNR